MPHSAVAKPRRQLSIIAILIVAIATPATLALSYYHLTGDPTFRPLAVTVERLVAGGLTVEHIDVQGVIITDGSIEGRQLSERLGRKLDRAFYGKGLNAHIRVQPTAETGSPLILFFVNGQRYGPFNAASTPQGIQIASEAVTIHRRTRHASSVFNW